MVTSKRADFDAIAQKFNIDKVLARIIRNRDVIGDEEIERFLNGDLSMLHDPMLLKDMDKAVGIIKEKIANGKRIRIIGDYDVDGICSTYILLRGLNYLGAIVDTVIPHRIKDGYGLSNQLIEEAYADGIDTILTCDNGIAAKEQIALAKSYGMTVVITDHHEVPYVMSGDNKEYILPPADAIVDPKQEDCMYPYEGICGALVAYKYIQCIVGESFKDIMDELLPFAAMATVCDVMDLLDENRIIVKEGLKRMAEPVNTGMKALIVACGLSEKTISAYHYGFVLGPTINATGRLDTARRALELFSTTNFNEACVIATELRQLNDERKKMTEDGTKEAVEMIEGSIMANDTVLVVYLPSCHESIAGIIAGRIKERYYKPTLVFTDAEEGVKGSGRSIEAYNMYEELTKVQDIFSKYGGHKMAAGMSLRRVEDIDILRKRLNDNSKLTSEDMVKKLIIDVPMPMSYANIHLVRSFSMLEPCGNGNPHPLFADKNISLISMEKRGKTRKIAKIVAEDEGGLRFELMYFDDPDKVEDYIKETLGEERLNMLLLGRCHRGDILTKIAYNPSINVYNNKESMQLVIKEIEVIN